MKLTVSLTICILSTLAILFAVTEPGSELYALPFVVTGSVAYGYALRTLKQRGSTHVCNLPPRWAANDNDLQEWALGDNEGSNW